MGAIYLQILINNNVLCPSTSLKDDDFLSCVKKVMQSEIHDAGLISTLT